MEKYIKMKNLTRMSKSLGLLAVLGCAGIVWPCAAATEGGALSAATASSDHVENAVVKIFSTVRYPDLYKPWTKLSPSEVTGSGVVIERKRILSNAHVVLYSSQVQVQANQSGDKVPATVEAIAPGI